jgi:hypothetical protein
VACTHHIGLHSVVCGLCTFRVLLSVFVSGVCDKNIHKLFISQLASCVVADVLRYYILCEYFCHFDLKWRKLKRRKLFQKPLKIKQRTPYC